MTIRELPFKTNEFMLKIQITHIYVKKRLKLLIDVKIQTFKNLPRLVYNVKKYSVSLTKVTQHYILQMLFFTH